MSLAFLKSALLHGILVGSVLVIFILKNYTPIPSGPIEMNLADSKGVQTEAKVPSKSVSGDHAERVGEKLKGATQGQDSAAMVGVRSDEYLKRLIQIISSAQHYPEASLRNEEEGVVQVRVILNSNGHIDSSEVVSSSGYRRLDQSALDTLNRVGTLPLPEAQTQGLSILIPIQYQIR